MSTDIRALLRSLAEDAPTVDNRIALADVSYTAGRRRRHVRHLAASSVSAIVMLLLLSTALFAGRTPLAAQYGHSSGSTVRGYPRQIGPQWPVFNLPAKPGPIAALIDTDSGWQAVSAQGHRWSLPFVADFTPALSTDGRYIGYLADGAQDRGPYAVRDLVSGLTTTFSEVGFPDGDGTPYQVATQFPLYFSPDDRYLAAAGFTPSDGPVVMDLRTGRALPGISSEGRPVGWSGDRLVLDTGTGIELRSAEDGFRSVVTSVGYSPLVAGGGQFAGQVSPDGQRLGFLIGDSKPERLYQYDITTGHLINSVAVPAQVGIAPYALGNRRVAYMTSVHPLSGLWRLVSVGLNGQVTHVAVHPSVTAYGPILAADAFDGPARGPLLLDHVSHAVYHWWWTSLVALALMACWQLCRWFVRRCKEQRAHREKIASALDLAPTAFSHRRKVLISALVLVPICATAAAFLAYQVVSRLQSGLRVEGSLVAWPVRSTDVSSGGASGEPAVLVVGRPGLKGFALLLHNSGGRPVTVFGREDQGAAFGPMTTGGLGVGIATTAGSALGVRTLSYSGRGVIPAHQSRWVRFLFNGCVGGTGGGVTIGTVTVGVRVGGVDRTQQLDLVPVFGVTGDPLLSMKTGTCAEDATNSPAPSPAPSGPP